MSQEVKMRLFSYVIIRVLLSCAIIVLFIIGGYSVLMDMPIVIAISIPFALAIGLYTTAIIVRYINNIVTAPLRKMLASASMLASITLDIKKTAEGSLRNTHIMKDVAGLLDEVADNSSKQGEEET